MVRDCYSSYFLAVAFVYWGLCTAHIVYFPLFLEYVLFYCLT